MHSLRQFNACYLLLLLAVTCVASPVHAEVLVRSYTATLSGPPGQAGDGERQIDLTVFLRDAAGGNAAADNSDLLWVQTQTDVREFSWLHRFGRAAYGKENKDTEDNASGFPAIRFDWGEGVSYVPVLLSIPIPNEPLTTGTQWESDGLKYEVIGEEQLAETKAWRVSIRNNFGEKRAVLVEQTRPVVLGMKETVFLGQGQQHTLNVELKDSAAMADSEWEKLTADFNHLDELRSQLGGATEQEDRAWTDEQLKSMKESLTKLNGQIATEAFQKLFRLAEAESKFERGRAGALDEMRRLALDRKLPGFDFETVMGDQLQHGDLDDKIAVIHFWDYRDAPLREPYGQVGYLDFLFRKYQDSGVRVFGVVVNQQAETPAQRRSAAVSARKFAAFMNLAYPLYIDTSTLLKDIGDPRACDASLPLFVVIGRDGQIVHYSAGYYQVEANQGLVELEAAVKKALDSAE